MAIPARQIYPISAGVMVLAPKTVIFLQNFRIQTPAVSYSLRDFYEIFIQTSVLYFVSTLCLKKRATFTTCCNFYIHSSIATIFDINVAEKVGNQNVLYFPTSPNYCFCTTWGNRKPGSCVFSLKCCMLFHQKTRNTVKNITQSELNHHSLSKRSSGSTRQEEGSIASCCVLPTCSVLAKSVTLSVAV